MRGPISRKRLIGVAFTAALEHYTATLAELLLTNEDARNAVASMKSEISQAAESAARLTSKLTVTFSKAWRWMLFMLAGGALVIGLAIGVMFERWLLSPPERVVEPVAPVVQPARAPVQKAPVQKRPAPKAESGKKRSGILRAHNSGDGRTARDRFPN